MDHTDRTEDEFEMRPMTAGLGFQKRMVSLKEHMAKTNVSQNVLRKSLPHDPPQELLHDNRTRSSKQIIDELHEALKPIEKPQNAPAARKASAGFTDVFPRDI